MLFPETTSQNGSASGYNADYNSVETQTKAAVTAWVSLQRPVVEAMTEFNSHWIDSFSKANVELIGFFGRRVEEDLAASRRLMSCRTVQDVMEAYSEFFQRAQQQYQNELQYFARLNQSFANESADAMRTHLASNGRSLTH